MEKSMHIFIEIEDHVDQFLENQYWDTEANKFRKSVVDRSIKELEKRKAEGRAALRNGG